MTRNKSPLDMPFFYFSCGLVWHLHFGPMSKKVKEKTDTLNCKTFKEVCRNNAIIFHIFAGFCSYFLKYVWDVAYWKYDVWIIVLFLNEFMKNYCMWIPSQIEFQFEIQNRYLYIWSINTLFEKSLPIIDISRK